MDHGPWTNFSTWLAHLNHFRQLPSGNEMSIEIDDHQRPVPHPTVLHAQYRAFHFHHANWAERFNRERNQIAQFADLSPSRRWLGFLSSGPPPPDEEHSCTSAHSDSSDICKPRSVCETDVKKNKMIA